MGGGPSGLSCAYYLALMGHKVTVYEEREKLGGMLRYGIPSYRFPRHLLDEEIESILSLGIEAHTNVTVGKDIWVEELQKEYDCLYIAIGAHQDKKVGIPGEDSKHVMSAVEMLRSIGDDVMPDFTGKRVVVIGGGVSKAGQVLLDGIAPYFKKYVFHAAYGVKFALASLGNDAGAYGAFKLILDESK